MRKAATLPLYNFNIKIQHIISTVIDITVNSSDEGRVAETFVNLINNCGMFQPLCCFLFLVGLAFIVYERKVDHKQITAEML